MSNMVMLMLLRRMKRGDLTAHGFRSSFSDWAAERTGFPREVVEMALAHAVENKVEAAYRRGDLFQALAWQPGRLEFDRDEARRIGDHMFGAFERGEFAADEVVVRFGEPSRIVPIARAAEEAKRAGYDWDDIHPSLWYAAVALTHPAAKRSIESCGLASAPRLLGEWFPDAISPTQTDAAAPPAPASPKPPTAAAAGKEPCAGAAKSRKPRLDATRPEISAALDDLVGTEPWEKGRNKERLRLIDQHLNKPAGWAKPRTLRRAIADRDGVSSQ